MLQNVDIDTTSEIRQLILFLCFSRAISVLNNDVCQYLFFIRVQAEWHSVNIYTNYQTNAYSFEKDANYNSLRTRLPL